MSSGQTQNARLSRLRELLRRQGAERCLLTSEANVSWLSGFTGSDSWLLVTPEEGCLLTDFRYREQARRELGPGLRISSAPVPLDGLEEELRPSAGVLLVEDTLCLRDFQRIREKIPALELRIERDLVESLRRRKAPPEIAALEASAALTTAALLGAVRAARAGISDFALGAEIARSLAAAGARNAFEPIVALGPDSALPHARPTGRVLEPGTIMMIDLGASRSGYCSDLSRTFAWGFFPAEFEVRYRAVLAAQEAALRAIRPGVPAREADAAARRVLEAAGMDEFFGHGLGHGVGIEVHEGPSLSRRSQDIIEEGMVFTVEPGVYFPGWGGIRIEDTVLVTAAGCRVLTEFPRDLSSALLGSG